VIIVACANDNMGAARPIIGASRVMIGFARGAFRNHWQTGIEKFPKKMLPMKSYYMSPPIKERVKTEQISSLY
jgi:hypothetical protein